MFSFQLHPSRWFALLACFGIFYIVLSGNVRYTRGDSRYSLLATQAILETGTMRLDSYADELPLGEINHGKDWMLHRNQQNKHLYYDYPVGTPIFSIPFVILAKMGGLNVIVDYEDNDVQILIAGFLLAAIFLLMFRLARCYLDDWAALIFALLLVLGTTLMSTLGTALWSQNFQTLFVVALVLELAEVSTGKRKELRPYWMGFLMFAAWLCRPTAMFLDFLVVVLIFWKYRPVFLKTALTLGGLAAIFSIWSLIEFGSIFPRYYLPGSWDAYGHPWENLWPILFGPARGLFSFTPIFLLAGLGFAFKEVRKNPLFLLIWLWLPIHTWMILQSKNPWGGWCYGPRFYTEMVPGLALALLITIHSFRSTSIRIQKFFGTFVILFAAFGVYVHTAKGIYNNSTTDWNAEPSVDANWPIVRSDWRYPQFLATNFQVSSKINENHDGGRVTALFEGIPEGEVLLAGKPDPSLRKNFMYWNKHNVLGKNRKVYNSVVAVHNAGYNEFWFESQYLDLMVIDWRVEVLPYQNIPLAIGDSLIPHPELTFPKVLKARFFTHAFESSTPN